MDDSDDQIMREVNDTFHIKEEVEEEFIDDDAAETEASEHENSNLLSAEDIKSEDNSMSDISEENIKDINGPHATQVDQELIKTEESEHENANLLSAEDIKSEDSSMSDISEENTEYSNENVKSELQNSEKTSVEDQPTMNSNLEIITDGGNDQNKAVNKSFKCIKCGIIFKDIYKARQHALIHADKKEYKCPENCKFKTKYLKKFRTHLLKHGKNKYKVEIIETAGGKRYEIIPEFDADAFSDSQYKIVDKNFECKLCGRKSHAISTARSHALVHSEKKLYKCPESCGYETNYFKTLHTHLLKHENEPTVRSTKNSTKNSDLGVIEIPGGKRYEIRPEFDADAFSDRQYKTVDKNFECKLCGRKSHAISTARSHALKHSEKKLYKCPESCGYETNYFKTLHTHLLKHENEPTVRSTKDSTKNSDLEVIEIPGGKRYEIRPEFDADAYSDSQYKIIDNNIFECMQCDQKSHDIFNARSHALKHSERKLYKCPERCGFETSYLKTLRKHLLKHEIEPTVRSTKNSTKNSDLEVIEIPGGKRYEIRPEFDADAYSDSQYKIIDNIFECMQCDQKSHDIFNARSHALKHSERKLYKCPESCGHETNYFKTLRTHLLNHENETAVKSTNKATLEIIETPGGKRYEIIPEFDANSYSDCRFKKVNKSFECKQCGKITLDISNARSHAFTHSERKLYKCPERCGFETSYLKTLRKHLLKHENEPTVRSTKNSTNNSDLEVIEIPGGKRYEIRPEFDADAYSDSQYKIIDNIFKCMQCDQKSHDIFNARSHALKHSERKLYKCPESCGHETNYFKTLRTHLLNHENKTTVRSTRNSNLEIIETPGGKLYEIIPEFDANSYSDCRFKKVNKSFECKQCGKITLDISNARSHAFTHSERKLYKCPERCGFETSYLKTLRKHLLKHENEISDSSSDTEGSVEKVEITPVFNIDTFFCSKFEKSEEGLLICLICKFKTGSVVDGKHHALSHSEKKLFNCPETCHFKTNDYKALRRHLSRRHKITSVVPNVIGNREKNKRLMFNFNTKKYRCFECNYITNDENKFTKSHQLLGPGFKWIKCQQCNYKTSQESDLKWHLKKHENEMIQVMS